MKPFFIWCMVLGAAICFFPTDARADAAADEQAKKLMSSAMEKDYMAGDFDVALLKLKQADSLCRARGCSPAVQSKNQAFFAIVHWIGVEDFDAAIDDLHALVKLDPKYALDDEYASPELLAALETARKAELAARAGGPPAATSQPAPKPAPKAAPPPAVDPKADESRKKDDEFRKEVESRKATHDRELEEARKAAETADARRTAEEKLAEQARKVEEAKKTAEEKKEAARKAAEERKAEAARRVEEAKKAAEEKKEAARKAIEDKKEAARKAIVDKKEAARKAIEDRKEAARKAAEDKREAARKAAEEAARKAEEARQAKEEQRLRTPPPVGKIQETPWREQTIGYPIPVFVKIPTPPQGVEPPRVEVVKVVTEYYGPNNATPQQFELKPLAGGGYGGLLPCDASIKEGDVTYYTTALNKFDNPVARGGSRDKPNKIHVKGVFTGSFPHLPGELPPQVCAEDRNAKVAPTTCQSSSECPEGWTCTKEGCVSASGAPALPSTAPHGGGCAGCKIGSTSAGAPGAAFAAIAAFCVHLVRRRRHAQDAGRTPLSSWRRA